MFYKQAITRHASITPINQETKPFLQKSASAWIDVDDFPDRYQMLYDNYKTAHAIKIGPYDPEFKYYRVIAMHGDIPNDNGDYWGWGSREDPTQPELLRIDSSLDKPVYATFVGRGNYKNHDNDDVTKAVGLVLDVAPNYEGKFIEALLAVDTKKDPDLVRGIDAGYIDSVSMGCVKAGTMISLPDGYSVPIENLKVGQKIVTHLGNAKEVKNLQIRQYTDDIYKIHVMGIQDPLWITNEHPMWVITKDQFKCTRRKTSKVCKCTPQDKIKTYCKYLNLKGEDTDKACEHINKEYVFDFIETENLEVGDWAAFPFSKEVNNPEYATKDFARLLGYYLSEGSCIKTKKGLPAGLSFCFNKKETDFINEVVKLLNIFKTNDNDVHLHNGSKKSGRDMVVDISIFDQDLAKQIHFLCGEYAKYKKLDQSVLEWSPEIQLELLGAYINGDGCSIKTKYHNATIHMSTASQILSQQLYLMLLRNDIIGYHRTIVRNRDRKIKDGIQYQINIGTYYNEKLQKVAMIKEPEKTTNNYTKRRFIYKNYLIAPITKIEKEKYDDLVYNFEVEDDNSYVANNMAVHNCLCGYSICSVCDNKASIEAQYCFLPETLITMHDGTLKSIADVQEGEYVLSADGNSTKVIKSFTRSYNDNIVVFKNNINGFETKCTKNHPILSVPLENSICHHKVINQQVKNSFSCFNEGSDYCQHCRKDLFKPTFMEAENLKVNDLIFAPSIHRQDLVDMHLDEEYAWILGLFSAEGSYSKNKKGEYNSIQFSLHEDEVEYQNRLSDFFHKVFKKELKIYNVKNSKAVSCRIHSMEIANIFYNLCGEYAHLKTIPKQILYTLDKNIIKAYLIGLYDGDGCYYDNKENSLQVLTILRSASKNLINQVSLSLSKLGYESYMAEYDNVGGPGNRTNKTNIYSLSSKFLSNKVNDNLKINKFANGKQQIGKITNIHQIYYNGTVYNLETEDGTYVANGLAVHNCDHIKYQKGQKIWHQGDYRLVYEDNREVNFIELSWVDVPADRDAKLLERVAHMSLSDNAGVMYNAIVKAMNDANIVCNDITEYAKLMDLVKKEAEKRTFS